MTVPIRRAPGWCAASRAVGGVGRRGRHDGAEAAAHVEDLPHLGVGDRAELLDELEDGRDRQRVGDLEADGGVQARQVQQPAAGDVGEAVDAEAGAQQLEHRADVDRRRLEQGVGHRGAAERRRAVVERERRERGAGQRVAVGVQPGGRDADQRVARAAVGSGDDLVERDRADAGGGEVEAARRGMAADQLRQHGDLAAGDLDSGELGAALEADADLPHHLGVGALDGEVVEHRERLGADAHDVVDVHRDAVDADGVDSGPSARPRSASSRRRRSRARSRGWGRP